MLAWSQQARLSSPERNLEASETHTVKQECLIIRVFTPVGAAFIFLFYDVTTEALGLRRTTQETKTGAIKQSLLIQKRFDTLVDSQDTGKQNSTGRRQEPGSEKTGKDHYTKGLS